MVISGYWRTGAAQSARCCRFAHFDDCLGCREHVVGGENGRQARGRRAEAILLAIMSAILFFIPIAGDFLGGGVAKAANISRVIAVFGTAGNAAFDVYTVVDDHRTAPLAIVGLTMVPLPLVGVAVVIKAWQIRREMSTEEIAKLGDRIIKI
jgi:hypothetical protein